MQNFSSLLFLFIALMLPQATWAYPVAEGLGQATTLIVSAPGTEANKVDEFVRKTFIVGQTFGLKASLSRAQDDRKLYCVEFYGPAVADEYADRILQFLAENHINAGVVGKTGECVF